MGNVRAFLFKDGKTTPIEVPNPWESAPDGFGNDYEMQMHFEGVLGYQTYTILGEDTTTHGFSITVRLMSRQESPLPYLRAVWMEWPVDGVDSMTFYFFETDVDLADFLQRLQPLLKMTQEQDRVAEESFARHTYEDAMKQHRGLISIKEGKEKGWGRFDSRFREPDERAEALNRVASALEGIAEAASGPWPHILADAMPIPDPPLTAEEIGDAVVEGLTRSKTTTKRKRTKPKEPSKEEDEKAAQLLAQRRAEAEKNE